MAAVGKSVFPSRSFLASLTTAPGVYQMQDAEGKVLYVGKARNLKKRIKSYFQKRLLNARLVSLVNQIQQIHVIVTQSETEALLLENQLIKKLHPRYNILLRDDKSFPFIVLSAHHFPRILSQRGERRGKGSYFGPYPNLQAVRETLYFIQKAFRLRTCRDVFFKNRTRPCLLYQIHRCSAPCVGNVTPEDYAQDVESVRLLLSGKNQDILANLIQRMEQAAAGQDYERAATLRDQIASLRHIQAQQVITTEEGDVDVFALVVSQQLIAVEVLFIRQGQLLGNKTFYPRMPAETAAEEVLSSFIPQYYLSHPLPNKIIIKKKLFEQLLLEKALKELKGQTVKIVLATQREAKNWIKMAEQTGEQAVISQILSESVYYRRLEALQALLHLPKRPKRMECFDISHSSGEATVASCVVFNQHGPQKSSYRRFNIHGITASDDYAAFRQVLMRRYQKVKKGEICLPDILFIDGGQGQLKQAQEVLEALGITTLTVVAVAKGRTRKPGLEQLFLLGEKHPLSVASDSPALHLIQHLRDEAHRFAVSCHRQKRDKSRKTSFLEGIEGIGPKKRRELLRQFGGLQALKKASVADLCKTPGISPLLAARLYEVLHV